MDVVAFKNAMGPGESDSSICRNLGDGKRSKPDKIQRVFSLVVLCKNHIINHEVVRNAGGVGT